MVLSFAAADSEETSSRIWCAHFYGRFIVAAIPFVFAHRFIRIFALLPLTIWLIGCGVTQPVQVIRLSASGLHLNQPSVFSLPQNRQFFRPQIHPFNHFAPQAYHPQ